MFSKDLRAENFNNSVIILLMKLIITFFIKFALGAFIIFDLLFIVKSKMKSIFKFERYSTASLFIKKYYSYYIGYLFPKPNFRLC